MLKQIQTPAPTACGIPVGTTVRAVGVNNDVVGVITRIVEEGGERLVRVNPGPLSHGRNYNTVFVEGQAIFTPVATPGEGALLVIDTATGLLVGICYDEQAAYNWASGFVDADDMAVARFSTGTDPVAPAVAPALAVLPPVTPAIAKAVAPALAVLPPVTPAVANDNFGGSYERDENGIVQALVPDFSECETEEDRQHAIAATLIANQQYTILHDNFGAKAAESTNYGWVSSDKNTTSKIRALNGYSTIHTDHGEDLVATRHFVMLIGGDGKDSPETDYLPGNAALAIAA